MKISAIAINSFAKWIVGGVPFEAAKGIVTELNDKDMTGEEKRQAAVKTLQTFGYALAGFLVNLAIELAVAWVKSQSNKPD